MYKNEERLHGLDAVRAVALLLGIWLHATMSFTMPIPALDVSQSTTLGVTFFVIHIFRMSAFYVIAGFFARMVIEHRGPGAFARDRARRIGVPIIAGWILMAPMFIAILIWGMSTTFPDGLPPEFDQQDRRFPLLHLWFLYYLCIFYVAVLALRWVGRRLPGVAAAMAVVDAVVARLARSHVIAVVLAAPVAYMLAANPEWIPWGGVPTPDRGLLPQLPAMVAFGSAFGFGWLLQRQAELLGIWRRSWPAYVLAAIVLSTAALTMVGPALRFGVSADLMQVPGPVWMRGVYAVCYTLAIWCWTFGLIGAGLALCSKPSPRWRYLADASYWMYLAHLPVVMLLQVVVAQWPLHWTVKFPLVVAVTMALLLVSYRYLVRGTFVGAVLNGRRYPIAGAVTDRPARPVGADTRSVSA